MGGINGQVPHVLARRQIGIAAKKTPCGICRLCYRREAAQTAK